MNKYRAGAIGLGLVVLGVVIWPLLEPYVIGWLGPRGSYLTVTYYSFPTQRVIAAMVVVFLTALAVFFLPRRTPPPKAMIVSQDTREGIWPPAPTLPK